MQKNDLHENEKGVRFVAGRAYVWVKVDGRLALQPWTPEAESEVEA